MTERIKRVKQSEEFQDSKLERVFFLNMMNFKDHFCACARKYRSGC